MFIGGWSKSTYLLEVDCFYPQQNKIEKSWNGLNLREADMVTKRPILYQDNIFVLGRKHIHIVELQKLQVDIQKNHGENYAQEVATLARKNYETIED